MDNLTEIPFYRIPCDCGNPVEATAAQAGATLRCSACGKSVQVPSFTTLHAKTPDGYLPTGRRRPYQFDLAELLAFLTVAALILSFYKSIDAFLGENFLGGFLRIFGWIVILLCPIFSVAVIRRLVIFVGDSAQTFFTRRNQ